MFSERILEFSDLICWFYPSDISKTFKPIPKAQITLCQNIYKFVYGTRLYYVLNVQKQFIQNMFKMFILTKDTLHKDNQANRWCLPGNFFFSFWAFFFLFFCKYLSTFPCFCNSLNFSASCSFFLSAENKQIDDTLCYWGRCDDTFKKTTSDEIKTDSAVSAIEVQQITHFRKTTPKKMIDIFHVEELFFLQRTGINIIKACAR